MSTQGIACWRERGVWSRSPERCPKLEQVRHCRNCDEFRRAGRAALDRQAVAAVPMATLAARASRSLFQGLFVFQLAQERLALPVRCLQEICPTSRLHRLPHRSDEVLRGLVAVRGRLTLCVCLGSFLGIGAADTDGQLMAVVSHSGLKFAFATAGILGMHRVDQEALTRKPDTLVGKLESFISGVFQLEQHSAGLLDPDLLVASLRRRLAP
ncbi:MAG: chemotaxis protein CheW [Armatimonadetes bacterium]|nr:chemotaxis protein CheW [Armatimonadota bacterium]